MLNKPEAGLAKRISSRVSRIKKQVSSAFVRSHLASPSRRHSYLPEHDIGRLNEPAENQRSPTSTSRLRIASSVAVHSTDTIPVPPSVRSPQRLEDSTDWDSSSTHLAPTSIPGLQPLHGKAHVQPHAPQEIVSFLPGTLELPLATIMHAVNSTTAEACSAGLKISLWWAIHLSIIASSRTTVRTIHVVAPILMAIFVSHERISAAHVTWSRI